MKKILLIFSLLIGGASFAQTVQAVNANLFLPNNTASLSGSSSLAKVQACGPDTNGYTLAKATGLQALNINNATSASAIGQYFDAPQSLTISGVSFYAYKIDATAGITMTATVQIFAAGADSLPTGTALATTSVPLDTNFYQGNLDLLRKHATFTVPVTTTNAYIVVVSNPSALSMGMIFNSWTALDGGQEWLSDVKIGANWLRSYAVNVGGAPFDADALFEPHISYQLNAAFTYDNPCFLAGNTLNFTNGSSPIIQNRMYNQAAFLGLSNLSYTWDFGDASPVVNALNTSHTYAAAASYSITLTDTVFGWTGTCSEDVVETIGNAPTATFTPNPSALTILLINTSTACAGAVYLWDFGDGNTSSAMNPNHTYAVAGTYTVCLTVTDVFGSNTTCMTVTVACGAPVPAYTSSTTGLSTAFTNTSINSGGAVYLWDFGDGGSSTLMNPTHTYAADGTYTVCLTVSDMCGADSVCQTVVISTCVAPTAGFTISGTSPTFDFLNTSSSTGTTNFMWDFGDGNTSTTIDPSHTYTANGTYTVILVVTDSCGGDQISQTVNVGGIGINELSTVDVMVYPNPSNGMFAIEASSVMESVEITDLSGKAVLEKSVTGMNALLDAQSIANGAYIVTVRFSNGTKKLVRIEVLK